MRTLTREPVAARQTPDRTPSRRRDLPSLRATQRSFALQRTDDVGEPPISGNAGFHHDFSRIPLFPPAPPEGPMRPQPHAIGPGLAIQAKLMVGPPNDMF